MLNLLEFGCLQQSFWGKFPNSLFHFEVLSSCLKQPTARTKEEGIQGGNSCGVAQTSRCSWDIWEMCILTEDHLSCLRPTCDEGTVFTVEPSFHHNRTSSSPRLKCTSLVERITANVCLILYTHLEHVWNVLKGSWLPEVCYRSKRPLQIGSYYKNTSKWEGSQARDQLLHMRGCSEALKNSTTAQKATFTAEKRPAVVPPCVF